MTTFYPTVVPVIKQVKMITKEVIALSEDVNYLLKKVTNEFT
ncbi:8601_t:CDS:2 [Cetraspora pellucida]|uniref:8601_t:CDS:1 n=1 Tax=Cetraspora pellucida TaxID=1433469 RepID=A0A9N9IWT0_9GLOM|nr:8601_t:CDS:2 [Cetraspora pellucida]